jgi:hypothetical protein
MSEEAVVAIMMKNTRSREHNHDLVTYCVGQSIDFCIDWRTYRLEWVSPCEHMSHLRSKLKLPLELVNLWKEKTFDPNLRGKEAKEARKNAYEEMNEAWRKYKDTLPHYYDRFFE